jgi:hypothetical protein
MPHYGYPHISSTAPTQSRTNAQGEVAPPGFHYMPDGTLMSDAEHIRLYSIKVIRDINIDFNSIKQSGETRKLTILGDIGAVFDLEIKNEDNYYYNFQTNTFQATSTKLSNITIESSISGTGFYETYIVFPAVTDADKYDFYLFAIDTKNTGHANYNEARFADGSIDINSSKGSNSNLIQKVIYQTLDIDLTISSDSAGGAITSLDTSGTDVITLSRGKNKTVVPFSITAVVSSGALSIDRQPTPDDVAIFVTRTAGATPIKLDTENEYPTARDAFTGDDVNGAVTSGSVVRMDNTDLSAAIAVGDKITAATSTDTVDGAVTSGIKVVMDNNVAGKMAVGDRITGNAALDATVVTVAALNPDTDNVKEFSMSEAVAISDGVTLTFSSKVNRSLTTVTVVETGGTATDFTMSQAIQFRDNQPLTFTPRKNYMWPIDNVHNITEGMRLKAGSLSGWSSEVTVAEYLNEITINENEVNEYKLTQEKKSGIHDAAIEPTITRNATTNVVSTTQAGNLIFSEQALLTLGGTTLKIYAYGKDEINRLSDYNIEFTDLKAELTAVTTTTTAAVANSTTMPVTSKVGIVDQTTQTVDGAVTDSFTVILDSVDGLGIGQSLYAVSAGTLSGTPTITDINETTKRITLSIAQTFADGITLTFANSIVSGIGIDPNAVNPYVVSISSLNLTLSAAQTLEKGQTFTFAGSGSTVTITGNIKVNNVGNEALTLRFDVDKFLTQH